MSEGALGCAARDLHRLGACADDVSLKTVRNHVSNIFTKLRVTTRAQAIVQGGRRQRPDRRLTNPRLDVLEVLRYE